MFFCLTLTAKHANQHNTFCPYALMSKTPEKSDNSEQSVVPFSRRYLKLFTCTLVYCPYDLLPMSYGKQ